MAIKKKAKAKASPKKNVGKKSSAKKSAAKKIGKPVVKAKTATRTAIPKKAASLVTNKMITPLDDRLVVRAEAAAEMTEGGLYIPASAGDRPTRGEVLAAGRGRRGKKGQLRPLDVKVGDQVLFPEFSGTKIMIDGEELLILREEDLLGIVI